MARRHIGGRHAPIDGRARAAPPVSYFHAFEKIRLDSRDSSAPGAAEAPWHRALALSIRVRLIAGTGPGQVRTAVSCPRSVGRPRRPRDAASSQQRTEARRIIATWRAAPDLSRYQRAAPSRFRPSALFVRIVREGSDERGRRDRIGRLLHILDRRLHVGRRDRRRRGE
jgi:hypothetical protein